MKLNWVSYLPFRDIYTNLCHTTQHIHGHLIPDIISIPLNKLRSLSHMFDRGDIMLFSVQSIIVRLRSTFPVYRHERHLVSDTFLCPHAACLHATGTNACISSPSYTPLCKVRRVTLGHWTYPIGQPLSYRSISPRRLSLTGKLSLFNGTKGRCGLEQEYPVFTLKNQSNPDCIFLRFDRRLSAAALEAKRDDIVIQRDVFQVRCVFYVFIQV